MFAKTGALVLVLSAASAASPPLKSGPRLTAPSERTVSGAFRFRDAQGSRVALADLRGRPVVIEFWATWCTPCLAQLPELAALQGEAARNRRFSVIPIHLDRKGWIAVTPFLFGSGLRELGFTTYAAYSPSEVDSAFGPVRSLPTTVLVDSQGGIAARWTGYGPSDGSLKQLLEELLGEARESSR